MVGKYEHTIRQFLKFAVVGTIGTIVDFGTYGLLTRVFGWTATLTVLGQHIFEANMVSTFLAILTNYTINRIWTFREHKGNVVRQGIQYFILNVVTWTLNQLLVSFFTFHVILLQQLFGNNRDLVAKVLAIGIILFLNFFGSKFLIFNKQAVR